MLAAFGHVSGFAADAKKGGPFTDPTDGRFDASEWLLDRKGFLPVPIVITEPAVGYGAGVAALFFRQSIGEAVAHSKQAGHMVPPDVFGVAVAATENGSKFMGGGGMFSFQEDRWRYRGGVGKIDVNLDFYGLGGDLGTIGKLGYQLDGWVSSHQVLRRLADTNHYLALRWVYIDLDSAFEPSQPRPRLPDKSFSSRSSGFGVTWEHDSRDNIFTPTRGWTAAIDTMFYGPEFGSDNSFQTYRAHVFAYQPVGKTVVAGLRLDARAARGDVPFYQMPFVDMRGIPAVRYQDENIAVAETEVRWNIDSRWAAIGFVGIGKAWGTRTDFGDAGSAVTKGVGGRYLIARRLGLYVGLDYAWGPEDRVFYIQVGNAWR